MFAISAILILWAVLTQPYIKALSGKQYALATTVTVVVLFGATWFSWVHLAPEHSEDTVIARTILNGVEKLFQKYRLPMPVPVPARPQPQPADPPPDVTLKLIYRELPALVLVNQGSSIAPDTKWTIALWNLALPERDDPLSIPVSTFDWIKKNDASGPLNLFDATLVKPLIKAGDHLFGSATVTCTDCSRGHTFVVDMVVGQGGWYGEIEDERNGRLIIPRNLKKDFRDQYFSETPSLVPMASRFSIQDQ